MDKSTALMAAELEALCFSSPWPKESFINILSNNNALYLVAMSGSKLVGYVGIFDLIDEFSVINIATHPDHRHKGIARLLLAEIHKRAVEKACPLITLEVRESNTVARSLYESFGYTEFGKIKNYYSDPKEDAILYKSEIKN